MKVNRKNLFKLIAEAMEDDELSPRSDFEKLMSALTSDLSNARQAWEMYDLGAYELSPEEEAKAKEAMVRVIVKDSDEPARDLLELDYDFHRVFEQAFGFTPPRSEEFKLWGGNGGTISEELSLRTTVDGKDVEFEFWWDLGTRSFDQGVLISPWFRFETKDEQDGYVSFEKGVISIDEGDDYLVRTSKEQLPGALRSAMGIPLDADVPEWPELPKGQPPVEGPEGTDYPVYEGKRKLNKSYLFETIAEVMAEMEENFGEMPAGGLLHEAWDSGWPKHFEELRSRIADQTTKGKIAENILFKYSMDSLIFRFLNAENIWEKYTTVFKNLTSFYFQTANERPEDFTKARGFVDKVLNLKEKKGWIDRIKDAQVNKGAMGKLRAMNKVISSLDKQLGKFWKSIDTEGMDQDPAEHVDHIITQQIQSLQFQEANLMTSRILNIIQFVDMDKSDDNAKKLTAFRKKVEKEATDDNIYTSIIAATNEWIEDELLSIDMTPCDDASAEWDEPCVFHQFDDGFFWYDVRSDNCDLSARHLNNCGQASMGGSELYNLMSYSETGKPRWHVMIEWNQGVNAIIQVLGNSNQVPKEEYWPHIKWFYEKMGKPEISNYAWEHVQDGDVKRKVFKFLQYLGVKSDQPLTGDWTEMRQQINDGFYNVSSYEGEQPPEGDFSRLRYLVHANRIEMSMRIKRSLLKVGSEPGDATYDDVRDYKNAARRLQRTEVLVDGYVLDMIPGEWEEFFNTGGWTQRVRVSHSGKMMLYLNWTTKPLQQTATSEYRNQLQRERLAAFMEAARRNFSVEAMTKLGEDLGHQLALVADEILMSRPEEELDEESQKILSELLQLNENEEPEFELPEFVKTLLEQEDHLIQAIELLASANGVEILCDREDENAYRKEYYFYVTSTAQATLLHHQLAPFFRLKRSEPGLDMWVGVGWPTEWPENWKECEKQLGKDWVQNGAILNISVDKL